MAKKFNETIYAYQLKNENPFKLQEWTHVMLRWHYYNCDTARSMLLKMYKQHKRLQHLSDILYNKKTFYLNTEKQEIRHATHPDRFGKRHLIDFLDDGEYDLPNKRRVVETHAETGTKIVRTTSKSTEIDLKTMAMLQKTIKQELELFSMFQKIDSLFGMGSTFGNANVNKPENQVIQDRIKKLNQTKSHVFPTPTQNKGRSNNNMNSLNRITSGASARVTEANVAASQRLQSMIHNKF